MNISHIFLLLWVTGLVVWLGMESDLILSGVTSQIGRSWHNGQSSPLKRIIIIILLLLFVPGSLVSHSVISWATFTGNNPVNPASDWPFTWNSALLIKCTDLFCFNFNNWFDWIWIPLVPSESRELCTSHLSFNSEIILMLVLYYTPHSEHLPWGQGYKVDLRHCYYYMYDWVASSSEHDEEIVTLHWTERQTDKTNIIKFI